MAAFQDRLIPSGSKDPLGCVAPRKDCQDSGGEESCGCLGTRLVLPAVGELPPRPNCLLLPRIRGFKYDEVNAILASVWD